MGKEVCMEGVEEAYDEEKEGYLRGLKRPM